MLIFLIGISDISSSNGNSYNKKIQVTIRIEMSNIIGKNAIAFLLTFDLSVDYGIYENNDVYIKSEKNMFRLSHHHHTMVTSIINRKKC